MSDYYACPRLSCAGQRILWSKDEKAYICPRCRETYIIENGKPTLKNPMVKAKVKSKPRGTDESNIQQAVVEWADKCKYKNILKYLHHSPNGGTRSKSEGARFKREGVKAGFPDLILPVARKGYHGLFIELKTNKGKASDNQHDWIDFLQVEGYSVHICRSVDEAIETIEDYLK